MELIDTHAHIFLEEFENDRTEVIQRALDKNVSKIVLPNVDVDTIEDLKALSAAFPENCFPAMGLHPGSINANFEKDLGIIEKEIEQNQYIGIGEIGIDLYWDKTYKDQQTEAFDIQLKWAKKNKLPIIVHLRNSYNEVIEVVKKNTTGDLKGIFHCFSGSVEQGEEIIEMGFYLGIGGVLTFKNSGLAKVVASLPIDKMVLETDAPYLTPTPHRGKRNESAYIALVAEKLAEIKNLSIEEAAETTTSNAKHLFKL